MKTVPTDRSVDDFLASVTNEQRRQDAIDLCRRMGRLTGETPVLWGDSIVGFGSYTYRYESGHGGSFMLTGFAPRKTALVVYILAGFDRRPELLARMGTFKTGKSCLYLKRLSDVDDAVLDELISDSVSFLKEKYPA
ncbi:MAG: DUF1801 domain-containing protein [Pseudomonadota bacterium]